MKILDALRGAEGDFVSGARLAEGLQLSRAAVHKQIQRLRAQGYEITGTPRAGYRLSDSPQVLNPAEFSGPLGRPFFLFPEISSTQEETKRRAVQGEKEGLLVVGDKQTAGRGRLGRSWESPVGGLWFSLLLRPAVMPAQIPSLPLVAALSLVRVLREETGLPAMVKWPNDVWIGRRKAAGILTEMSSEMDRVHWVVLGVGLNVNNAVPRGTLVPAISLKAALGRPVSRHIILKKWLKEFDKSYRIFLRRGFSPLRPSYLQALDQGEIRFAPKP
jgi:BirA family transcriptional regulator, biotin operon repressor / biotin---[acetyl-CoA-carboxylase] ligase